MKTLFNCHDVEKLVQKYYNKGGDVLKIDGCLVDNYICFGENLKTAIIKEVYLNEWSSANSVVLYNKTPKKYEKVIDAIMNGENDEKISKLFF